MNLARLLEELPGGCFSNWRILSAAADPWTVGEAAKAGVVGYILKDQRVNEISETLHLIGAGNAVFSAPGCSCGE